MTDDYDSFSSEERIAATNATLSVLDALDNEELQAAAVDLQAATCRYRDLLIGLGVKPKAATLSTLGACLGQFFSEDEADDES